MADSEKISSHIHRESYWWVDRAGARTKQYDPENTLIDQLMVLAQNKTTIIISHRLFVTPMVDRILVLEHGRLVEEGTHQQLMKFDGVYAKMFKTQVGMYWPSPQ